VLLTRLCFTQALLQPPCLVIHIIPTPTHPPHRTTAIYQTQIGGPNLAVIDKPDAGPQFGAEGLSIPLKPIPKGDERLARTKLGTYYKRTTQGTGKSLWGWEADAKKTNLRSVRVYVAASGGAQWTLDPGSITWRSSKGGQ